MDVTLLNFKTRSIFIFGVFVLLRCNGCASTRTAVFMYDKEDATADEIKWLSENILNASTRLLNDGMDFDLKISLPHQSYTEEISENPATTTSKTDSNIKAQSTLERLLARLQESPSYSTIFVITNVSEPSHDGLLLDSILEQMQIKRTQVNFIFGTEFCSKSISDEYRYITDLSSNSFVMGPEVLENKFAESIYVSLRYVPQRIQLTEFEEIVSGATYMPRDSFIQACLSKTIQSHNDLNQLEKYPDLEKPYRTTLKNAIEKDDGSWHFTITDPTKKCPMCDGTLKKTKRKIGYVYGLSRDDFNFEYGFSTEKVLSLNETFRRPIKGSNYIYLLTNDEIWIFGFYRFRILFMNGSYFGEIKPLYLIENNDLFTGSFEAPDDEYFFIEVTTFVNDSAAVCRITTTAMIAVEKFGDDRNPAFEYNPAYERKPVSFKWAEYSRFVAAQKSEDSQDTTTNSSISFYDIVSWIFSAAFLGVVIPCIPYFLFKIVEFSRQKFQACCKRGRKILQRLKFIKTDNQAVPKVKKTKAGRKVSK